jgi:perosamine synthetase
VAARLNGSPWLTVPPPWPPEERAPDSIQFNLVGIADDAEARAFAEAAAARREGAGLRPVDRQRARLLELAVHGRSCPICRKTRAMLMRACDVRLPARLQKPDLDFIAEALITLLDSFD